jgi:hypothetical protein
MNWMAWEFEGKKVAYMKPILDKAGLDHPNLLNFDLTSNGNVKSARYSKFKGANTSRF